MNTQVFAIWGKNTKLVWFNHCRLSDDNEGYKINLHTAADQPIKLSQTNLIYIKALTNQSMSVLQNRLAKNCRPSIQNMCYIII